MLQRSFIGPAELRDKAFFRRLSLLYKYIVHSKLHTVFNREAVVFLIYSSVQSRIFFYIPNRSILAHETEIYPITKPLMDMIDYMYRIGEHARKHHMPYYHAPLHHTAFIKDRLARLLIHSIARSPCRFRIIRR